MENDKFSPRELQLCPSCSQSSRVSSILYYGTKKKGKIERRKEGRNGGLAHTQTSDDTLPTVLDVVNIRVCVCVCEELWRMFCIKETKCQCVVHGSKPNLPSDITSFIKQSSALCCRPILFLHSILNVRHPLGHAIFCRC